ncbi:MAG: MSCRAMM family protein [Planctomycetota bacterium]
MHNFGVKDRATIEELAPGEYRVTASVGHGDPTAIGVSDVIHLDGSREHTTVTLAMEAGPPLTVEILDAENDESIEYAAFRLVRSDGLPVVRWSSGGIWCIRPRDGRHTFEHLAPGEYTLEAFKEAQQYGQTEYAAVKTPIQVRTANDRDQNVTVKLEASELGEEEAKRRWPWSVTGKVTNSEGQPLEGVEIRASCGVGTLLPTGSTTSDAEGRYTLRFGPGMRSLNEDTGAWGAGLQAATIFASKQGFTEQNLCRQGGLIMADEMPLEDNAWGAKPSEVVLPHKPHKLDFVMVPSASLELDLLDEDGKPIGDERRFHFGAAILHG